LLKRTALACSQKYFSTHGLNFSNQIVCVLKAPALSKLILLYFTIISENFFLKILVINFAFFGAIVQNNISKRCFLDWIATNFVFLVFCFLPLFYGPHNRAREYGLVRLRGSQSLAHTEIKKAEKLCLNGDFCRICSSSR